MADTKTINGCNPITRHACLHLHNFPCKSTSLGFTLKRDDKEYLFRTQDIICHDVECPMCLESTNLMFFLRFDRYERVIYCSKCENLQFVPTTISHDSFVDEKQSMPENFKCSSCVCPSNTGGRLFFSRTKIDSSWKRVYCKDCCRNTYIFYDF
jgi:hypothetical protein